MLLLTLFFLVYFLVMGREKKVFFCLYLLTNQYLPSRNGILQARKEPLRVFMIE